MLATNHEWQLPPRSYSHGDHEILCPRCGVRWFIRWFLIGSLFTRLVLYQSVTCGGLVRGVCLVWTQLCVLLLSREYPCVLFQFRAVWGAVPSASLAFFGQAFVLSCASNQYSDTNDSTMLGLALRHCCDISAELCHR